MVSLTQAATSDITSRLSDFDSLGGVIDFKIFNVSEANSDREGHWMTALQAISSLRENPAFNIDRGIRIPPEQFFGPYFDFKEERPILLGRVGTPFKSWIVFQDYYYYDDPETSQNIVKVTHSKNSSFVTQGYADAFLNPPHGFGKKGMTNYEIGKLFLDFNEFLFDNVRQITVYSWPTDTSSYFENGKEWWGSFFWTVYNPIKDWHIAITASTTD